MSDFRSRVLGTIIGTLSRGSFPKREPVAFLYGHIAKEGETPTHSINGVDYVGWIGPDIYSVYTPELQEKYRYAYIVSDPAANEEYMLYCTERPMHYGRNTDPNDPYLVFYGGEETMPFAVSSNVQGADFWHFDGEANFRLSQVFDTIWANTDMELYLATWDSEAKMMRYEATGTIGLAASEPVPVYE